MAAALDLEGRVAVVTGASSGIGEATVRALSAEGMQVVAAARRGDRLEQLATDEQRVTPQVTDVTDLASVKRLADLVAERFGVCHLLVNNAGANHSRRLRSVDDVEGVEATLDVNLLGVVRCCAALAPLLEAGAPSRVVNVASIAGKVATGAPAYSASKFGLVGLSEAMRPDWLRRGVAVCQLNPGLVTTEGFPQTEAMRTPGLRRLVARPEQVADAVVEVARSGQAERSVPRWYRSVVLLRHLAPPAWRVASGRV